MKRIIQVFLLAAFAAFFVSGCGAIATAWNYGKAANDATLIAAEATLCTGVSYGAVIRRYGFNSDQARARRVLCKFPRTLEMDTSTADPIK